MAKQSWVISDFDGGDYMQRIAPKLQLAGAPEISVRPYVARGGLSDGVLVLDVTNGNLRYSVLPTRGMGIWRASWQDELVGWKSPVRGPVHPKFVDIGEPGGLGWLDGFDELLVRCGLESNGAPGFDDNGRLVYPLHGRIANKPASRVEVTIDDQLQEVAITGVVEETRLHFLKLQLSTTLTSRRGESGFQVRDVVQNLSDSPAEMQMLYHTNFGVPLLDAGARVVAPVKKVVPRNARAAEGIANWASYGAPEPGFEEQVYFCELLADGQGATLVLLKDAHSQRGVGMRFNTRQLPWFTVWKNTTSVNDGYVTGLEPGTNFPNPRDFEGAQGRVVKLPPRGSAAFDFGLSYLADPASVETAEKAVSQLQGSVQPQVFDAPQADWCA